MDLNKILRDLDVELVKSQDDIYVDEILSDINEWFKEESVKQDYLEKKFRDQNIEEEVRRS
jgi:hypothetical protein